MATKQNSKPSIKLQLEVVETLTVRSGDRVATYWIEHHNSHVRLYNPNNDSKKPMTKNQLLHYFRRHYTDSEITVKGEPVESTLWPEE